METDRGQKNLPGKKQWAFLHSLFIGFSQPCVKVRDCWVKIRGKGNFRHSFDRLIKLAYHKGMADVMVQQQLLSFWRLPLKLSTSCLQLVFR